MAANIIVYYVDKMLAWGIEKGKVLPYFINSAVFS